MAPAVASLVRADLSGEGVRLLHRGGWANADVWLVPLDAGECVIKDYAGRGTCLRHTLARWLVRREARAYRQLAGLSCVPSLLRELDELALVLEYRPGRGLSRSLADSLPEDFVPALENAVQAMHARGVVHLDLRHRSNLLADADGRPVLIDFASAICSPAGGFRSRVVLGLFGWIDRLALRKWRVRLAVR